MTTLENIITRYRRTSEDESLEGINVELEVRFELVDYMVFETIFLALYEKKLDVGVGVISHTINGILTDIRAPRRDKVGHRIRQITIDTKTKDKTDTYIFKQSLVPPLKIKNTFALSYKVALSTEETIKQFSADGNILLRVKNRISFITPVKNPMWRIDMTITRAVVGGDIQRSLTPIVNAMFHTKQQTPDNWLQIMGIISSNRDTTLRASYNYEIEIEHIGYRNDIKPGDIIQIVDDVLRLSDPEYVREAIYQREVYNAAGFIINAPSLLRRFECEFGLKKLLPPVKSLTRGDYTDIYPPLNYYITDKAHGNRALAIVREGRLIILSDKLYEYYIPELVKPFTGDAHISSINISTLDGDIVNSVTILDGELLLPSSSSSGKLEFYAFDVVVYRGDCIASNKFELRIEKLSDSVKILELFGLKALVKPYIRITSPDLSILEQQFKQLYESKKNPYEIDGIILVEPGKCFSDTITYKWKPVEDTSIDFLARLAPQSIIGTHPFLNRPNYTLYILFVGININLFNSLAIRYCVGYNELFPIDEMGEKNNYFPIQFQTSDAPLAYIYYHPNNSEFKNIDGKVIELTCVGNCVEDMEKYEYINWKINRIREDRDRDLTMGTYYGNDFRIAELTWVNYIDPFPFNQLYQGPTDVYFARTKSGLYRAPTAFTSFVKNKLIQSLSHRPWVIDLGSGKGQDLGRYFDANIHHLIAVDRDRAALSELIRRKYSFAMNKNRGNNNNNRGINVHVIIADLIDHYEKTFNKISKIPGFPKDGVNAIVSNLVIHYMLGSTANMNNIAILCSKLLRVGGDLIITTMFGANILKLLNSFKIAQGDTWKSVQGEVTKYGIKRLFSEDTLTPCGQEIGVLLPFSDGNYYVEYLTNVKVFTDTFCKRGFKLLATPTFSDYEKDFKNRNSTVNNLLTDIDRQWLGLYGVIHMKKIS